MKSKIVISEASVIVIGQLQSLVSESLKIIDFNMDSQVMVAEIELDSSIEARKRQLLIDILIDGLHQGKRVEMEESLFRNLDEFDFSVRTANCLKNCNLRLVGQLVQKKEFELLKSQNFGRKSLNEINDVLGELGLTLGMHLSADVKEKLTNTLV